MPEPAAARQQDGLLAIPGREWFMARASRPRYRWASRSPAPNDSDRRLWRRKPAVRQPRPYDGIYERARHGRFENECLCPYFSKPVSKECCRKRFGRDLRPGELRRLP